LLSLFIKHSPIYAFIKEVNSTESRVLKASENFQEMIGVSGSQMSGKSMQELFPPEFAAKITADDWSVVSRGEILHVDEELNGRFYTTIKFPILLGGKNFLAGYTIDLTERKQAEEEKKALQQQLLQAQKIEAIGTLAGGIAHDFNNILGAIIGYTEMAKEHCPAGSKIGYNLDRVLEAGGRAINLVKQILAFSRKANANNCIPMKPKHLIKEAIKLLRPALPSTITITLDLDTATQSICSDPNQFHQIVMNLCTNAFHAMEQTGGVLGISLKDCELEPQDLLHHPIVKAGRFVVLSIADSGPGIAPEIQDKIFDPYFTTKEVGKGTGLGLSIVHGIATTSGGFVTCESELGTGTVFRVFFPGTEEQLTVPIAPVDRDLSGRERILLIDDEEILVEMGKVMLERLGYKVTIRTSSLEALSTFQEQPNEFNAVITDQTMPSMTGIDLARRMLQIRPNIPIILCTGHSSLVNEAQARAYGVKELAMKPFTKNGLAALLRKVLDDNSTL
jgi:PAS domain S-box-containing protein